MFLFSMILYSLFSELKQGIKKENLKSAVQKAEREPGVVMKENNGPIKSKVIHIIFFR